MMDEAANPRTENADEGDGARAVVRELMKRPGSPTVDELRQDAELKSLLEEMVERPDDLLRRLDELEPELQWAYWMVERLWRDQKSPPPVDELGADVMGALIKLHGEAFLAAAQVLNEQ
jgi:hypothetical protein